MNKTTTFLKIILIAFSFVLALIFSLSTPGELLSKKIIIGIFLGAVISTLVIGIDLLLKKYHLRALNTATLGLFFGYLIGQALVLILDGVLDIAHISTNLEERSLELIKICLFLLGIYLGSTMTARAADELYITIPFIRFSKEATKKKDLIIDSLCLSDSRIVDLAATGLLDHQLILPTFVVKDLYSLVETSDETQRERAKKSLDTIKKLSEIKHLSLRTSDSDFPEIGDLQVKMIRLARLLNGNILTSDSHRMSQVESEGVSFINLQTLSIALKPLTQTGETFKIKIQRVGKEPSQGVGYLDDGTMVVVNGGGSHVHESVLVIALSIKHSSSGRIIFCNLKEG